MNDEDSLCKCEYVAPGQYQKNLASFEEFFRFVNAKIHPNTNWIFRGQRRADWELVPSIFRNVKLPIRRKGLKGIIEKSALWETIINKTLAQFKQAARGRCGLDKDAEDDKWWALGRHHGLKTPLLDWTRSPYVALFFAFVEENVESAENQNRAVFMLHWDAYNRRKQEINKAYEAKHGENRSDDLVLQLVEPYSHENSRLVNQSGLFIKGTDMPFEKETVFTFCTAASTAAGYGNELLADASDVEASIKVVIPDSARRECLEGLDRMNINYLSLFPDVEGSALHCNLRRGLDASES
jgi:hypothetical protein